MKTRWLIVFFLLLILGCRKDQEIYPREETALPSYIKTLLVPDTNNSYDGCFYIHASFTNTASSETRILKLDEQNAGMALRYDSSEKGAGFSEHTVMFVSSPAGERLEISFYYDLATDTAFRICCADYLYGDAWKGIAGANVQYCRPTSQSDGTRNYIYQGVNSEDSYFKITHLGNNCINGTFHTTWKECCGEETTYEVTGDFSIPVFGYQGFEQQLA